VATSRVPPSAAVGLAPAAWEKIAGTSPEETLTMTTPFPAGDPPDREAVAEWLRAAAAMPPEQQKVEMAACVAIDALRTAIQAMRLAMDAAIAACGPAIEDSAAMEVRGQWAAGLLLLSEAFGPLERRGMTTYHAVRAMLAVY